MAPAEDLLLDTNVVVDLIRDNETGRRINAATGLSTRVHKPLLSVVSIAEAMSLAEYWGWGAAKRDSLSKLFQELVVLDTRNPVVLERYAEIQNFAWKSGKAFGNNDVWIAATAAATGATLITCDKDFLPLDPKFTKVRCFEAT